MLSTDSLQKDYMVYLHHLGLLDNTCLSDLKSLTISSSNPKHSGKSVKENESNANEEAENNWVAAQKQQCNNKMLREKKNEMIDGLTMVGESVPQMIAEEEIESDSDIDVDLNEEDLEGILSD
jgi:hypothetical protein